MDHAQAVSQYFGIEPGGSLDFTRYSKMSATEKLDPQIRKSRVRQWKVLVVAPRIRRMEDDWFREQLASLGAEQVVPLTVLLPIWQPTPPSIRWARWGKTMWRFYRARCVARVSGGIPLVVWGFKEAPTTLKTCPFCGCSDVGLWHFLQVCAGTSQYRCEMGTSNSNGDWYSWALQDSAVEPDMKARVKYFGLCSCTVAHAVSVAGSQLSLSNCFPL